MTQSQNSFVGALYLKRSKKVEGVPYSVCTFPKVTLDLSCSNPFIDLADKAISYASLSAEILPQWRRCLRSPKHKHSFSWSNAMLWGASQLCERSDLLRRVDGRGARDTWRTDCFAWTVFLHGPAHWQEGQSLHGLTPHQVCLDDRSVGEMIDKIHLGTVLMNTNFRLCCLTCQPDS